MESAKAESYNTDKTKILYQKTLTECVYDREGKRLDNTLSEINNNLTRNVKNKNNYDLFQMGNLKIISLMYSEAVTIPTTTWHTLFTVDEKPLTTVHGTASDASGNSYLIRLNIDGTFQIYSNKQITTSYIMGNLTYL